MKTFRQITRQDLVEIGLMVVKGDIQSLENVVNNAKNPDPSLRPTALQVLTASVLHKAILKGDASVLNILLDRFFGKTPVAILVAHADARGRLTPEQAKSEAVRLLEEAKDG